MIPDTIRTVLTDTEIENIERREGWAVGTVAMMISGEVRERATDAYIELFNGDGQADPYGGVRFYVVHDGELMELYGYATRNALVQSDQTAGWYVEEWTDPEDPDYGKPAPDGR